MPHSFRSFVAFALVVAFTAGCSNNPVSLTSPSAAGGSTTLTADQTGGRWRLLSISPAGQMEQTVPANAFYELTLDGANGRVSTRADCNVCSGSLVINSRTWTLTIGPALACTRAACPTMAFESAYVRILAGDSLVRIDGDPLMLTLTSSRGVLRFGR